MSALHHTGQKIPRKLHQRHDVDLQEIGLPLGVCLVTGEQGGVRPLPRWLMALLNGLVNLLRSVPFLILMIIVIPLSRLIVGT